MLADESLDDNPKRRLLRGALVTLMAGIVIALMAMGLKSLISSPDAPKRQMAKISILPDTPPPPPPPPKEEPKREPPKQERPQPQQEQPKPQVTPPPDQQIKMEGAAGDGPSAFAAGSVNKEYSGGPVTSGGAASTPAPTGADRANERFYANTARQLLRDELERQLQPDASQLTATFAIWVDANGRIERTELQPSGDEARDGVMRSALDGTSRALKLPPPPPVAQPMRFRLTLRGQG